LKKCLPYLARVEQRFGEVRFSFNRLGQTAIGSVLENESNQRSDTMKNRNAWFVIAAIVSTCAIGLAVSPQDSTNSPAIVRGTTQPTTAGTSVTSNNAALPPMYQGTISNLHDRIGTNAVNHGNANPDIQAPHVPPQ
jgi:hypothetical protein